MKRVICFVVIFLTLSTVLLFGQKGKQKLVVHADTLQSDSLQYELLIFDTGFESWLATKPSINYFSKSYYEFKNRSYVTEWNNRHSQWSKYGAIYEDYLDYRPGIDYGLELNYRLYYYFLYFEHTNNVKLVQGK